VKIEMDVAHRDRGGSREAWPGAFGGMRPVVAVAVGLVLTLALAPAAAAQAGGGGPPSWHGEVASGVQWYAGDRLIVIELGGLRRGPGNRSLGVGGRFLLAPEPGSCVGIAPCPDGPLRLMAAGVQLEHRFHLGRVDGEMPTRFWVAPRAAVSAGRGGGRVPLLELGAALGHEVRLGATGGLWVAARAGLAATHEGGRFRTAGGPGLAAGFRWGL
jgi:hypothetical protein